MMFVPTSIVQYQRSTSGAHLYQEPGTAVLERNNGSAPAEIQRPAVCKRRFFGTPVPPTRQDDYLVYIDILDDPSCGIADPATLFDALCAWAPEALCLGD